MNELDIKLTDKAAKIIQDTINDENLEDPYLAFYISGGGCSGLQYGLALADGEPEIDDVIVYDQNIKIAIDFKSSKYISGSIIDYIDTSMGGGFKIDNPKAVKSCGCSKSFAVGEMEELSEILNFGGCNSCGK